MFLYLSAKTITQQTNIWLRYFDKIDWDQVLDTIINKVGAFILFSLLFIVLYRLGRVGIHRAFDGYQHRRQLNGTRTKTMQALSLNVLFYLILFFYIYTILTIIGIPVGTLLAGAGVAGIAIGLGAQGFVNDVVTGFFILLEGQFDVGDAVKLGTISGTVTSVGLRTTVVKSSDGTVNFIPNRNISIVSNLSRSNMQVLIKLPLAPSTDLDEVHRIIAATNKDLVPQFETITDGPDILGLTEDTGGKFTYQILMYAENGEQLTVQRAFLSAYVAALTSAGITVINPQLNLS